MDFLTLDADSFTYGEAQLVAPRLRRVIAHNPSKFTYHGTGTYIVGGDEHGRGDVVVIDPGPVLDDHRDALERALTGCTVRAIAVTHCHSDHSPLAAWLRDVSGAPTYAYGPHGDDTWDIGDDPPDDTDGDGDGDEESDTHGDAVADSEEPVVEETTDRAFTPDVEVRSGDVVAAGNGWSMTALHTPGHTSNHTCFAWSGDGTRTLFTGDHVMGWSTTVVSPPDGDMAAYLESLRLVAGRADDVAVPTHGPPIADPAQFVAGLVEHRLVRERQVSDVVRSGITTVAEMVEILYADVRRELHKPARRSVLAHLVKLVDDGTVAIEEPGRPRLDSTYRPV